MFYITSYMSQLCRGSHTCTIGYSDGSTSSSLVLRMFNNIEPYQGFSKLPDLRYASDVFTADVFLMHVRFNDIR